MYYYYHYYILLSIMYLYNIIMYIDHIAYWYYIANNLYITKYAVHLYIKYSPRLTCRCTYM